MRPYGQMGYRSGKTNDYRLINKETLFYRFAGKLIYVSPELCNHNSVNSGIHNLLPRADLYIDTMRGM